MVVTNYSIEVCEASRSTIGLLELGRFEGIGMGIGLGIVAGIGLTIKALFVWYIQCRAPKDRPINTLMWHDQLFQFVLGLIFSVMTIAPIFTQTPLSDYVGTKGCYFYWIIHLALSQLLSVGGFGMAVFRLFCLGNLFVDKEFKRTMAKKILIAEMILTIGIILLGFLSAEVLGVEVYIFYQYCTNQNPIHAKLMTAYTSNASMMDPSLAEIFLKIALVLIFQALVVGELVIYLKIMYDLWKHNKTFHEEGIISHQVRKHRNHKNVITLKGQILSFIVEMISSSLIIAYLTLSSNDGPSHIPIVMTFLHTIVSLSQFISSHDLKQHVKQLLEF